MKLSVKILCALLAVMMLLAVMASCGETPAETTPKETTEKNPETTKAPGTSSVPDASDPDAALPDESTPDESESEESTTPDTEDETTSITDLKDLLPPDMDLGRDMTIFVGTLYYDEWLDSDDGDIVGSEIYNRVLRVEKNLGIDLTVDRMPGDSNHSDTIIAEVEKRQESTDPNMIADLCSTYSMYAGKLTISGRYQNIANSDMIDLENPWWPKDLLENSTIDDKVYFVSGDISPTLIYETYAIFYNLKLTEQYNIEDPINLVNSHKWTLDKVISMTSGIYEDLDTSVKGPSQGDFFAFNFNDNAHIKAFPFAMGVRVVVPDDEEGYVFSEIYSGTKTDTIVSKMVNWIDNNNGVKTANDFNDYGNCFKTSKCIFTVGNFAFAAQHLAGSGIDYAVVPCPLYDEDQTEYYSYYGNPTSFWGVPTNADVDDSCALLESLAADAYVYVSPALFERALKIKYVTGEVDGLSKMFDIIRDGLVFDACMFYKLCGIGSHYSDFNEIANSISSWSSKFDNFEMKRMNKTMTALAKSLRDLEY